MALLDFAETALTIAASIIMEISGCLKVKQPDRQLRIDVTVIKDMLDSSVTWISLSQKIANFYTKRGGSQQTN